VLASGPTAAIVFQVVILLHLGYLDPFFLVALVTTTAIAWAVSCVVGRIDRALRAKHTRAG